MNPKDQRNKADNNKMIIIIALSIVVIVSVLIAIFVNVKSGSDTPSETQNSVPDSLVVNEAQQLEDEQKAVRDLVLNFRSAFAVGDINTLNSLCNTTETMDADTIAATASIVEAYENTTCYIREGLESNTYVAFIYDDLKIVNIDILVPNISFVYVMPKPEGGYYIYRGEYDNSEQKYSYESAIMNHVAKLKQNDQEINQLYADTNTRFNQLREENKDLEGFVKKLTGGADTEETSKETETTESDPTESNESMSGESSAE